MSNTILVTGAAGHLGQRVIHHLLETYKLSTKDIVAVTRSPEKLAALAAKGVTVRKADFDDAASLPAAFSGVDRALIVSTDVLDKPGHRLVQHKAAIEAAVKAGVKHVLYTSMPKPDDSLITFAHEHKGSEDALIASGLTYTIFRNGWYMENYFMGLPHAIAEGKWYTATGDGRVANVARNDIAQAIAAVLADPSAGSATYTFSGPKALTAEEIAAIVRDVTGKPLAVIPVTDEQLAGGLKGAGLPEAIIPAIVSFDSNTREGKIDGVTGDIEKLIGRKPQDLKSFLTENKAVLGA